MLEQPPSVPRGGKVHNRSDAKRKLQSLLDNRQLAGYLGQTSSRERHVGAGRRRTEPSKHVKAEPKPGPRRDGYMKRCVGEAALALICSLFAQETQTPDTEWSTGLLEANPLFLDDV